MEKGSQYKVVSGSTSSNEESEETSGGGEQENLNEKVSDFWPLFSKKKSSNF